MTSTYERLVAAHAGGPVRIRPKALQRKTRKPRNWIAATVCLATAGYAADLAIGAGSQGTLAVTAVANALLIFATLVLRPARSGSSKFSTIYVFLGISYIQGCVLPLLGLDHRLPELSYRVDATSQATAHAALISTLFTGGVAVGWLIGARRVGASPEPSTAAARGQVTAATSRQSSSENLGWLLVLIGILGLLLRSGGSVHALLHSFSSVARTNNGASGLSGTITTSLLPVGTFLLVTSGRPRVVRFILLLLFGGISALALASYSLNRAAILIPIVAMLVTQARWSGRRIIPTLIPIAIAASIAFVFLGIYRNGVAADAQGLQGVSQQSTGEYALDSLEVYLQSPSLTGIVYDQNGPSPFDLRSTLASAATPLPVIGRPYRTQSGSSIYNAEIYGGLNFNDQILPVWAEIERAFGIPGLLLVALGIGLYLARLDSFLGRPTDKLRSYTTIFWALWVSQVLITSIAVLSQIAFYFLLPLLIVSQLRSKQPRSAWRAFSRRRHRAIRTAMK